MTWGHPLQQQDPAGFYVRKGGKKHFLFSLLLPTAKGGGAPVCGLLVLIWGEGVYGGHFSFVFVTPFGVLGKEGLLQATAT